MAANDKQQNSAMSLQVGEKPPLANHDSSVLDLAFAMDVTGSMGSYIHAAQQSIRQIVEEIVSAEKSDIRMALVEYRDHPPQDRSFVTRTHDFTDSVKKMKGWLDESKASGGGDTPEAVADAMHDVLKLSWRPEATKICVLVADAPPHGLIGRGDSFPNGCPNGLDPVVIINQLAEKSITVYSVGCEPAINHYRDFFMALAHITGGQYVPLGNAKLLAKVIIGGAQEEITLQRLMEDVHEEVMNEMQTKGGAEEVDTDKLAKHVQRKLAGRGARTKALMRNDVQLDAASDLAQTMATKGRSMADWKTEWDAAGKSRQEIFARMTPGAPMSMTRGGRGGRGGAPVSMKKKTARRKVAHEACEEVSDLLECSPMPPMATMACDAMPPGAMPPMAMMSPPMRMSEESAESYSVVDTELNLQQAQRMVQKSIAMNKKNFTK